MSCSGRCELPATCVPSTPCILVLYRSAAPRRPRPAAVGDSPQSMQSTVQVLLSVPASESDRPDANAVVRRQAFSEARPCCCPDRVLQRPGRNRTSTLTYCQCENGFPGADRWQSALSSAGSQPSVLQSSFPGLTSSPELACQSGSGALTMIKSQMCKYQQQLSCISSAYPHMGLVS